MSQIKMTSKIHEQGVEPFVYAVILNWNGLEDTVDCVNSVLAISYSSIRIHVIDNGSNGNDIEVLRNVFETEERVLIQRNDENLGFSGGCNIGIRTSLKSGAKFTLLLNNDTIVDNLFLKELVGVAQSDERVGIVGPKIFYFDQPSKQWEAGKDVNYFFPPLSVTSKSSVPVEVTDVVGCAMLIRNEAFRDVGTFDEEYFAYGEESDLNFRFRKHGYKIFYCPDSHIWHKVSASTGGSFNPVVAYYKTRNKIKFARKNLPVSYWPTYFLYLILFVTKQSVVAVVHGDWLVIKSMAKGIKDAL